MAPSCNNYHHHYHLSLYQIHYTVHKNTERICNINKFFIPNILCSSKTVHKTQHYYSWWMNSYRVYSIGYVLSVGCLFILTRKEDSRDEYVPLNYFLSITRIPMGKIILSHHFSRLLYSSWAYKWEVSICDYLLFV